MRASRVAAWAIRAKSIASWTLAELSMAKPVERALHHIAVVAEDGERVRGQRAGGDVEDGGVSSPAILNMLGILAASPWDAVKVQVRAPVWSAPWTAPAAPPSLCISTT